MANDGVSTSEDADLDSGTPEGLALRNLTERCKSELLVAEPLNRHEVTPLVGEELDASITELKGRLIGSHPVLPLLTGEVIIENPKQQLPLVFKLAYPKIKDLNSRLGEIKTDRLIDQIKGLVKAHFCPSDEEAPSISILNQDFKGSKAILNLSDDFTWQDFVQKTDDFQEALNEVIERFFAEEGLETDFPERPKMVFGATEWEETDTQLLAPNLIRQFLLCEHVSNMTLRRVVPENIEKNRGLAVRLEEKRYKELLLKDFNRYLRLFKGVYFRHKEDAVWRDVFQIVTDGGSEGLPFLSLDFLQFLRKGRHSERYAFIPEEEMETLRSFYSTLNTIDVLKPFLGKDLLAFAMRLEDLGKLLSENPETEEEKQKYLTRLSREADRSLKDQKEELADPIAHTRLAFAKRLQSVLASEGPEMAFVFGDVIDFGPNNLVGLYLDLMEFKGNEDKGNGEVAFEELIKSAGDRLTAQMRDFERQLFNVILNGGEVMILDTSGGDEVKGILPAHLVELLNRTIDATYLRNVFVKLPSGPLPLEQVAAIWAHSAYRAEQALDGLKSSRSGYSSNQNPSVNMIALQ